MHDLVFPIDLSIAPHNAASILPVRVRQLCFEVASATIIDHIDLDIDARGCTAILGYNGAGKSVLLRLLHGLLTPTSGVIHWSGGLAGREIRGHQAMVFQTPKLLRRTVAANIRFVLAKRGVARRHRAAKTESILAETKLSKVRDRSATVLSGGERQRLAIARALAGDPDIVFLDEPTASLDPAATMAIEQILQRAVVAGRKLIMVTQDLGQAQRIATDVVFMHHGRIMEHTPMSEFLNTARSREARAFIDGQLIP